MKPDIVAIDVDLGRYTAVSSTRGVLAHSEDPLRLSGPEISPSETLFLIEIAGPIMHRGGDQRILHHTHRWMIYNAAVVGILAHTFERQLDRVLVATSTAWTMGYPEAQRHQIAGICPKKYSKRGVALYDEPHDIREARCMIYFYRRNPEVWKPLDQWLREL